MEDVDWGARIRILKEMRSVLQNKKPTEMIGFYRVGFCRAWDLVLHNPDFVWEVDPNCGPSPQVPAWFQEEVGWDLRPENDHYGGFLRQCDGPDTRRGIEQRLAILDRIIEKYQRMINQDSKGVIVSAFPATGKSWVFSTSGEMDISVCDSDSEAHHWVDPTVPRTQRVERDNWVEDYIDDLVGATSRFDVVFCSTHEEVRNALVRRGIPFVVVHPTLDQKDDYIARVQNRKTGLHGPQGVKLFTEQWETWLTSMFNQTDCRHIVLGPGEYLYDVIERITTSHPIEWEMPYDARLQFLEAIRNIYTRTPSSQLYWVGFCNAWDCVRWTRHSRTRYDNPYTDLPQWFKDDVGWKLRPGGNGGGYLVHCDLPDTDRGLQQRIVILDRLIKKYKKMRDLCILPTPAESTGQSNDDAPQRS